MRYCHGAVITKISESYNTKFSKKIHNILKLKAKMCENLLGNFQYIAKSFPD